jgi:RNA polymerase sigma factor (sigma-70 family)
MKAGDREKLWDKYKITPTPELREQLILEYAPLVKIVAGRLCMYLGNTVEYEDLCSYGIFGLIDAIDKFDLAKDVKFETYASLRIRGSILDHIRKMDWVPRTLRQKQKRIDGAVAKLEEELGRPATDIEIADELGITLVDQNADLTVTVERQREDSLTVVLDGEKARIVYGGGLSRFHRALGLLFEATSDGKTSFEKEKAANRENCKQS